MRTARRLFVSIIIFLVLLEAGLRLTGKWKTASEKSVGEFFYEWGYETKHLYSYEPNDTFIMDIGEYRWEYHTNDMGYRERNIDTTDTSGIRGFVIGDSFVEGNGTAYDSSFTRHLEGLLRKDHPDADLYICGISGFDPFFSYVALAERLMEYKPTHVIVSVNDSDFDDYTIRGGFSRFKPDGKVRYKEPPAFLPYYRYSHIVRVIVHEFLKYDYYLIRRVNVDEQTREAADSISACLLKTYELCEANGIRFLAVIYPTPHEICYEDHPGTLTKVISLADKKGYPAVHLYEPLKKNMKAGDCLSYCWYVDSHFNRKGYALMGDILDSMIRHQYPSFWEIPG